MSDTPSEVDGRPGLDEGLAGEVRVVAKGGAVQLAGQICQRGLSFFFNIIAFRILGGATYGIYRQVAQVLAIAGQVALAGFNYASMRWISRARADGDAGGVRGAARVGIYGSLIGSAIVVAVLLIGAEWLAEIFSDASEEDVFIELFRIGIAYVPLFALLQVFRYCTQAYKTMMPSVVAGNIVQPGVRFVLGVILLLAGFELVGAVVSLTVSIGVAAVVAGWFFLRMLTPEQRSARPVMRVREMVRFALPQAGSSLLGVQTLGYGILIVGAMGSNVEAGVFAAAISLQGPANVFLGGIVNIWAPVVADLHARDEIDRLDALYKVVNRWIVTFSLPVSIALILEADVFAMFYGSPEDLATIVAILAVGNIFYTATGPTGYVISMTGHPTVNLVNSVIALVLYIGGGFLVVPKYGAIGMAVVDSSVTAIINSLRVVEAKMLVGIQPFGRTFYKPVVATLVAAAFLLVWSLFADGTLMLEIAGLAIGLGIYLVVLKLLGVDPEERHVYERIRKRAFKGRRG